MGAVPNKHAFETGHGVDRAAPVFAFSAELEAQLARELERFPASPHGVCLLGAHRAARADKPGSVRVVSDLPYRVPPLRDELALWRAFLSDEIEVILKGEQ